MAWILDIEAFNEVLGNRNSLFCWYLFDCTIFYLELFFFEHESCDEELSEV